MMKTTFSFMVALLLSGTVASLAQDIVPPTEESVRVEKEPTKPLATRSRRNSKKKKYFSIPYDNDAYNGDAVVTIFGTATAIIRRQLKSKSANALPYVPIDTYPTYRPPTSAQLQGKKMLKSKNKSKKVPTDALTPTPSYKPYTAPPVQVGRETDRPRKIPTMKSWTEPDW
eukprot:CAMPEP_0194283410 /NCGR_PEP_ID=MMETSP0169-20130528/25297_1 /TAXON_ID=218684 /ORGANISM="Corethron pennatum, Strain L29A3" /LENGTH=170 /DNA_ID=CAMNT_0039029003 /DNA_START=42 /DNA_END=554 /DNA_ORIENTATION=-